jgi:hypothetical protein
VADPSAVRVDSKRASTPLLTLLATCHVLYTFPYHPVTEKKRTCACRRHLRLSRGTSPLFRQSSIFRLCWIPGNTKYPRCYTYYKNITLLKCDPPPSGGESEAKEPRRERCTDNFATFAPQNVRIPGARERVSMVTTVVVTVVVTVFATGTKTRPLPPLKGDRCHSHKREHNKDF